MSKDYSKLFEPFKIGNVEIKNRFVMGPMGMNFHQNAETGAYSDEAIPYFEARAKGGFGLIFTGVQLTDLVVDPPLQTTMFMNTENYIKQGLRMNEAVEKHGAKMFLEIGMGVGRNYPGMKAPSAKPVYMNPEVISEPYTTEEVETKVDLMIKAAVIAKQAGFSGVDIHTLHWGYLIDEFVLGITNDRTDKYGGDLDGRLTVVREIVEGIHRECGDDFPVTIGLGVKSFIKDLNKASLDGSDEAGRTVEESVEIAKKLEEMGVAAIMCDVGIYDSFYYACPPSYVERGHAIDLYKPIKEAVSIPVMARSRLGSADICLKVLEDGDSDAVVLARPALADPEFPNKIASGNADKIRPCIGCNMGCIAKCVETYEHECCAANPSSCFELLFPEKKTEAPKKIAVVGGGPGGMQACITGFDMGHQVELFEKEDHLGGEMISAGAHEFKGDILELMNWFIREVREREVPVHLNTEFTEEICKAGGYDLVIMATGAGPVMPGSIKGIEKAMSAVELLETEPEIGENVMVVGGGMVGCETAVDLAKKGKKVTLVEMQPAILSSEFVPQQEVLMLKDMLEYYGVTVCTGYSLAEVTDKGAILAKDDECVEVEADKVIMAVGLKPVDNIAEELEAAGAKVVKIGSAVRNGNVIDATHGAFRAIYELG